MRTRGAGGTGVRRSVVGWLVGVVVAGVVVAGVVVVSPGVAGAVSPGAVDGVGVVDTGSGLWYLRDPVSSATTSFYFGNPGDVPFVGDWDCDGVDTPGLYRQSDGYVYLRNSNSEGVADRSFFFGDPGDVPLVGDFDGDGCDTVSIYRPSGHRFFVIDELGADDGGLGEAAFSFEFGDPGDTPFVGDFDGDGIDTVGLHRVSTGLVYFRNTLTTGVADAQFVYGDPGDRVFAGHWTDSHTVDTVGLFRPSEGGFYLNHANRQGNADDDFLYGNATMAPITGHFGTLPGGDELPPGVPETPPLVTSPVLAIGDSVMLGGKATLESTVPTITVDAEVSRPFSASDEILSAYLARNPTPGVLVIHLGTNGPPTSAQFDALMAVAKKVPRVIFMTVKLDKSWEFATNQAIATNAARFENAELLDWQAYADPHPSWFSSDVNCGCHLWNATVRNAYADFINGAIDPSR